jgi:hypothetical protein
MCVLAVLAALEGRAPAAEVKPAPKVEVAFVLDTTGSMQSLIEGAKAKIWYVANQIVLGQPRPVVRMGLVAYRDKGDQYVTKVYDLTDNIDQVYRDLMSFQADGGNDTPEHVNKALEDAVTKLTWSKDPDTLRVIYLVGDSPAHNEYTDTPKCDQLAKTAITRGIYINTILCGTNQETATMWRLIAERAEGKSFEIEQGGGVQTVATPYDEDLARLNSELVSTVVVYGSARQQAEAAKMNRAAAEIAAPASAADRAAFASNSGRAGTQDLVQAVADKSVDLSKMSKTELPENMQKMSPEEQARYIASNQARRDEVNEKIQDLSGKRAAFVKTELEKGAGAKAGFDKAVVDGLKDQARKISVTYE